MKHKEVWTILLLAWLVGAAVLVSVHSNSPTAAPGSKMDDLDGPVPVSTAARREEAQQQAAWGREPRLSESGSTRPTDLLNTGTNTLSVATSSTPDKLLAELQDSDKGVRQRALEAVLQIEDRSIVPRLRELAAKTEDAEQKAQLLAVADFIALPSIIDYLDEQKDNRGQANSR